MTVVRIQSKTIRIPDELLLKLETELGKAAGRYGMPDSVITAEIIWHVGLNEYTIELNVPGMFHKAAKLASLEDDDVTKAVIQSMPIYLVEIPAGSCKAVGAIDTQGTIHWRPI
jgi:hypothetical protein